MTTDSTARWRSVFDLASGVIMVVAASIMIWLGISMLRIVNSPASSVAANPDLPNDPVSLADASRLGTATAPVVLIAFSDFECPVCAKFSQSIMPQLQKTYIDTGKLAIFFRHFPLEKIHPLAFGAAAAAECAGRQGQFWPMHDFLFLGKDNLRKHVVNGHAKSLGLDATAFGRCVDQSAPEKVRSDLAAGFALSVRGTPSLFVGIAKPGGVAQITARYSGIPPGTALVESIDAALEQARK